MLFCFRALVALCAWAVSAHDADSFAHTASLMHAALSTCEGTYTWNLSAAVSKKERIQPGIYILVPTTFEPGVFAHFEASLYCAGNLMNVQPYSHSS